MEMDGNTQEFTPRAYQVDLYEKAILENTIIYLPTGSGKTFIAVMLIKKYSNQVQLPYSEGGKRIIFIVNTVPLVSQQSEYIARHTGLVCRGYSGDMAVDYWTREEWHRELEPTQVLVMVGDIFLAILNHGHMPLGKTCLLIFDECHKAVGNHPMRNIMKTFERVPKEEHPRVLGLTATLLNANIKVERVQEAVRELEITFHARVATVNSEGSVREYGNLRESITFYDPPKLYGIEDKIQALFDYMISVLDIVKLKGSFDCDMSSKELSPKPKNVKLKNMVEDGREHIETMGLYGGSKAILMHIINLEYMKKSTDDYQTVAMLEFLLTQMTKIRKLMDDEMNENNELKQIRKYSSDQILKTFEVLQHFNTNKLNDQKFCCIIFVKRRTSAITLYHILSNLQRADEKFAFLRSDYMIGYTNNPYKNPREALCLAKWNKQALLEFRSGRTNCIVATDVVDEGVDVPSCTLILRYDLPVDFRGYIQSKGRARHKASRYVILLSHNDDTFIRKYDNFQRVETHLKQALIGHTDGREEVSEKEIDESLYINEIEPYTVVGMDGMQSTITGISAISLVNRYCANLIKSKFVYLTPTWKLHKISNGTAEMKYKVSLTMPPISPLKVEIAGDVMDSITLAKRSAALKTCIKLHQMQELSDQLLPVPPSAILADTEHLFPHWREDPDNRTGTMSKKSIHKIIQPEAFYASFPVAEQTLHLHLIQAKPAYSQPYENRQLVFYKLLNDDAGFALLTMKPMPQIPGFPIFMNVGELNVSVKVNHATLTLSDDDIAMLQIFHWIIFNNVLNLIKNFMAFDKENLGNSFLIVPTDQSGNIDWTTVKKYQIIEEILPSDQMNFFDFHEALVTPNYRTSPNVYVVTQICDDIMAESAFPNGDFHSYMHYYKERHDIVIQNPKQPMLEVKAISKKINCIRPRGIKAGLSKRKCADILEDFEEHFVGELCKRTMFPALYWLKATYLPSVLHRVCQLLVAEDLRVKIVKEACVGVLKIPRHGVWQSIVIKQNDNEEQPEMLLEQSTNDDSFVNTTQLQPDMPGPEIDTLESKLYPWKKESEPVNLYRDIEQIQLIDIEYYHQFMSIPMDTNDDILKKQRRAHQYETRPSVKAPSLSILTKNDTIGPSPSSVMQALTAKSSHDVFDLERLETLGDSFLKFAVSLYLHEVFPKCNEGQLTVLKGRLLGNRNLFYCGENKGIPGRMKVDEFEPLNNFIAPAFTVPRSLQELLMDSETSPNVLFELRIPETEQLNGVLSLLTISHMQEKVMSWEETNSQTGMDNFLDLQIVSDKTVADGVEALIGVYLSHMGLVGAFKILMWFGILPQKLKVEEFLCRIPASPRVGLGDPDDHMPQANYIEKQIGYKFIDRAFLLQAFTHPSYIPNNITPSYERLEFLGDAILDFLITVHIYESCDYLSPGALTDLRSALVNNITFACLAVKYGFHTALMSYAPKLQEIIERFVKFQEDRNYAVDDELLWILLEEEDCKMAEYVEVPKILGDLFESVIGAIYLDSGKNLVRVWEIVYSLMHKEIIAFSKEVPKQPIRVIYETAGANPKFTKPSKVEGSETVMITLEVTIAGVVKNFHGFGANQKQAKCAAAKQALKCIRSNV